MLNRLATPLRQMKNFSGFIRCSDFAAKFFGYPHDFFDHLTRDGAGHRTRDPAGHRAVGFFDSEGNPVERPARAVAFCGIGSPDRFRFDLEQLGIELALFESYRDHQRYRVSELRRLQQAAARRGVGISDLRARQLTLEDFDRFDLLLAMDDGHHRDMLRRATREQRDKVRMFMEAAAGHPAPAVPDPYYGGPDGFESVLDMIEEGARAWLRELEARSP